MASKRNTIYTNNELASDYHRLAGAICYFSDCDLFCGERGSVDNMYLEYSNNNQPIAIIDFKMPGKTLSDKYSAIQLQINTSNKLEIPFYFLITYLDERYPIKMYYLIPINQIARNKHQLAGKVGQWLSVQEHSKFQHWLRGKKWNANEVIDKNNLQQLNFPMGLTLGQLSEERTTYLLPDFSFSWMA